ncbi:hypothetical protein EON79_04405 [bacterium]|nr:MAG: hypothetical protein EON79_04405 [bacterium]
MLRRIRHLNDIPGLVDTEAGGEKWWEEDTAKSKRIAHDRHMRLSRVWKRSGALLPRELKSYCDGGQYDAPMLGHSREGTRFTLTSSDMNAVILANWGFGLPWNECHFPFDLAFEGVSYVGWRTVDRQGRLTWSPAPAMGGEICPSWMMDHLMEPELPGIRWALLYRGKSSRGMLLVEARSMKVVERQREAWIRLVGRDSLPVFEQCHAQRRERPLNNPTIRDLVLRELGLMEVGEDGQAA